MSEPEIKLRLCKFPSDLPEIMRLEKRCFAADAFPVMEFLYLYGQGRDSFWIMERGEDMIAYLIAYIEDDYGYIASLAVSPDERRKGLAKTLIETLINFLKSKPKIKGIILHVRESNHSAIALYKKFKFVEASNIPEYYADKETGIEMKLDF